MLVTSQQSDVTLFCAGVILNTVVIDHLDVTFAQ